MQNSTSTPRAIPERLAAFALTFVIVSGAATASGPEIRTLEEESPRPLAEIILKLADRYELPIVYEDPPWEFPDDIEDITWQFPAAKDRLDKGLLEKPILVPRSSRLSFSYLEDSEFFYQHEVALQLLKDLVGSVAVSEHPNWFEVEFDGYLFHIVPVKFRNSSGAIVPHRSPLDLPIYFPAKPRTIREVALEVIDHVNQSSGVPISIGYMLLSEFDTTTVTIGADGESAREVLSQAFRSSGLHAPWLLYYSPRDEEYLLSVYHTNPPRQPG